MDPNLKQRIIDEAYVLFLTKGMKQTSFCDVAAAVSCNYDKKEKIQNGG